MIDLHIHTSRSDGGKSLDEILKLVNKDDIISITDHNITGNYKNIIKGIEIETKYKNKRYHFILLNFDEKKLKKYKKIVRSHDIQKFYKQIKKLNINLDKTKVKKFIKNNEYFDRVRLNNLLVELNLTTTPRESYYKYTQNIKEGKRKIISLKDLFYLEKISGGILVLAHPTKYFYNLENTKKFILYLKNKYNLKAVEVYNNHSTIENIQELEKFCVKHNLLISGGSDYHAKYGEVENKKIGFVHDIELKNEKINILKYLGR